MPLLAEIPGYIANPLSRGKTILINKTLYYSSECYKAQKTQSGMPLFREPDWVL